MRGLRERFLLERRFVFVAIVAAVVAPLLLFTNEEDEAVML